VLYRDAGRTNLWGDDDGVDTLGGTGTGAPVEIDVFGRVPMQQTAPAGDYADTIIVTVTW
jgi:spore coat protein U-like protein